MTSNVFTAIIFPLFFFERLPDRILIALAFQCSVYLSTPASTTWCATARDE